MSLIQILLIAFVVITPVSLIAGGWAALFNHVLYGSGTGKTFLLFTVGAFVVLWALALMAVSVWLLVSWITSW